MIESGIKPRSRVHGLGIWALGFGYFVFYTPYSGLTKAVTKGLLSADHQAVSGLKVLPLSVVAMVVCMFAFITVMGWWKYSRGIQILGVRIPFPRRETFFSGMCMGGIVGTTTLAFSFAGASIVFVLILLRAGVLVLGPTVDALLKRRVRWFSWTAMAISLLACLVALADVDHYRLRLLAVINIGIYLTSYFFRFRLMTRLAKSADRSNTIRYFVEEQITASPLLLIVLALVAWLGRGGFLNELWQGFALPEAAVAVPALLIGVFYAALCVCTTFIFLDRRENTFCIPMHSASSLLSGIAAAIALTSWYAQPGTSSAQYASAGLMIVALGFLSPLHHVVDRVRLWLPKREYVDDGLRARIIAGRSGAGSGPSTSDEIRQPPGLVLFVCSGNTCRSPMAEAIWNAEVARRSESGKRDLKSLDALSAGLSARPGKGMTSEARRALDDLGVPVFFPGSRPLTEELVEKAEAIYCMTQAHVDAAAKMFPGAADKTWRLDPNGDVEDPIGAGVEVYARCATRLQGLVRWRLNEASVPA